jgi:hypothetical protein
LAGPAIADEELGDGSEKVNGPVFTYFGALRCRENHLYARLSDP